MKLIKPLKSYACLLLSKVYLTLTQKPDPIPKSPRNLGLRYRSGKNTCDNDTRNNYEERLKSVNCIS
eukprot:snap_masked-scaffold_31-processed-gene-3.17-mRNA-1 protein AED:1.00 eAED:1.00 QI:0/0/0/0/1/1/2/0/66